MKKIIVFLTVLLILCANTACATHYSHYSTQSKKIIKKRNQIAWNNQMHCKHYKHYTMQNKRKNFILF
jgi:hypothetical protein